MIQTPGPIQSDGHGRQHFLHAASEIRIARSRIVDLVQFAGKAAKIVNRARGGHYRNAGLRHIPVR